MEAQNTGTLKCEHIIVKADECILQPERYHFNIDMIKDNEISTKCKESMRYMSSIFRGIMFSKTTAPKPRQGL